MKRIFTYILGGALVVSQMALAAPDDQERGRGRGHSKARVSANATAQTASATARQSVQRPTAVRQSMGNSQQVVRTETPRTSARTQARVMPSSNQTTVARASRDGTARSTTSQTAVRSTGDNRQYYNRDGRDWDRDRNRDGDRWRDRDWSDRRYYRPPINTYRNWDHNRIYTWNDRRWQWYGGSWVIYDTSPSVYYTTETVLPAVGASIVENVQEELQDEGYDPGPADGVMGSRTRSAIAQYQDDHGLAVTGTINDALLRSLGLT